MTNNYFKAIVHNSKIYILVTYSSKSIVCGSKFVMHLVTSKPLSVVVDNSSYG